MSVPGVEWLQFVEGMINAAKCIICPIEQECFPQRKKCFQGQSLSFKVTVCLVMEQKSYGKHHVVAMAWTAHSSYLNCKFVAQVWVQNLN